MNVEQAIRICESLARSEDLALTNTERLALHALIRLALDAQAKQDG